MNLLRQGVRVSHTDDRQGLDMVHWSFAEVVESKSENEQNILGAVLKLCCPKVGEFWPPPS